MPRIPGGCTDDTRDLRRQFHVARGRPRRSGIPAGRFDECQHLRSRGLMIEVNPVLARRQISQFQIDPSGRAGLMRSRKENICPMQIPLMPPSALTKASAARP